MALPRRRVTVCCMARPLELYMQPDFGRVEIESGSQLGHRKTFPEADLGNRGIHCRLLLTSTAECGAPWRKAEALAVAQNIAINGSPLRIASQAFATYPQISDLLDIRAHCLDSKVDLGWRACPVERSEDCWRQFGKAPAPYEEDSTSE